MKKIYLKTENEEMTRALAEDIIKHIQKGWTIALDGELAAGKSVFSSAAIKSLGYTGKVTSPTYTIMNEYDTPEGKVFHMDAYRLGGADELEYTGYYDALEEARVIIIEWAEIISGALEDDTLYIKISKDPEDFDVRIFEVSSRDTELINTLSEALNAYIIH